MGYNISNWKELQKELLDRAKIYPAKENGQTPQGYHKYVQNMVIYGLKNKPANVKTIWANEETGERLITSFIEEIE